MDLLLVQQIFWPDGALWFLNWHSGPCHWMSHVPWLKCPIGEGARLSQEVAVRRLWNMAFTQRASLILRQIQGQKGNFAKGKISQGQRKDSGQGDRDGTHSESKQGIQCWKRDKGHGVEVVKNIFILTLKALNATWSWRERGRMYACANNNIDNLN